MLFIIFEGLLLVLSFSLFASAQLPTTQQDAAKQNELSPPAEYHCKGKGTLAVFGRLTDPKGKDKGIDGATVTLSRSDTDAITTHTDDQGRYCIRYSAGADITSLWFEDREASCVEQISGSRSHYINKLLDGRCSALKASVTLLGPKEAADAFGSEVAKRFGVLQLVLSNTSEQALQILSVGFEQGTADREKQANPQSDIRVSDIVPVDPSIVDMVVARQRSSASLFHIGPVSIISILLHDNPDARIRLANLALRLNELIPSGSSVGRVVFVDRSKLPLDAFETPSQMMHAQTALGNVVVRANRLMKTGEVKSSGSSAGHEAMGRLADPLGSELGTESVTAVAAIH